MKTIVSISFLLFLSIRIIASPIDSATAKIVGTNFLNERLGLQKGFQAHTIELEFVFKKYSKAVQPLFYIFNFKNNTGFIIVSASDNGYPVLGYSFESSYSLSTEDKPEAFLEWMETTEEQLEYIQAENLKPDSHISGAWGKYRSKSFKSISSFKNVSPILATTWNQGTYYNSLCPLAAGGPNGHVWAGCVAVSMAQVLKYWNYPAYGSGQHSYSWSPYGIQTADFASTTYNWSSMPNSLSSENNAVATLMYHCGVSVNMQYSPSGSGAYMNSAANAFKTYFDYSPQIELLYKWLYSDNAWDSILRAEMDLGQPVSYAGGNHAFNIDGYQGTNYFHLNWGWGGSYNGYFYLSALNPGSYNFTSSQQAIVHIRPNCGMSPTSITTLTHFSGNITDNGGTANNYMNCSDSKIVISPPGVTNIKLFISEFKTVFGQDTLYVYDGENVSAPLLYELTGDIPPFEFLSSTGMVFLRFKSNGYNTDKGYKINYISAFDDTGVTGLLSPIGKTCGNSNDSIRLIVKNFGISDKINIPIKVVVNTPNGTLTFNKSLPGPLSTNQSDTLFVGFINTSNQGNYHFSCYTKTIGDTFINSNDTLNKTINTKEIQALPFFENVDDLNFNMQDWIDLNRKTFINLEMLDTNSFFRAYVGGGEGIGGDGGHSMEQFLVYDRKIGPISQNAYLYFDYRILSMGQTPFPAVLTNQEKIKILVSSNCGIGFDTIFTINAANHITDSAFLQLKISLENYDGQNIIFGFITSWDANLTLIDYDNIQIVDSVKTTIATGNELKSNAIRIFPNPTMGRITIDCLPSNQQSVEVIIYDFSGKTLRNEKVILQNNKIAIDLKNNKSGLYFIEIKTSENTYYGKIIKE